MATEEQKAIRMSALAATFPAMRAKMIPESSGPLSERLATGLSPWDLPTLAEASKPWTGAEKLIVQFLAHVWNADEAHEWVGHFNVVEAYQRWDEDNWRAFTYWALNPFYC